MTTHKEERAELHTALKEFASSPRFSFLKLIQVGPLLGDDASSLGPLAEMTFEELMIAAEERSSHLQNLDESQERLLITVLQALAEGEAAEVPESGVDSAEESENPMDEESSETTFNSVQCELELRDQVARLKGHPELEKVAGLTLGRFWHADAPRAPFEESLTVGQFLGLDLGVVAKKRSMTSARMRALAQALAGAAHRLGAAEEKRAPSEPDEAEPTARHQPTRRAPNRPSRHRWYGYAGECAPLEMALVESVMSASSDDERDAMNIFGALHHFSAVFTPADFLLIINGRHLTIPTQRKLVAWVNSNALGEVVPPLRLILQGPGTHISRIARMLQGHNPPTAVFAIVSTLIIRGLGAHQVSVGDVVCPDVWTSNPGLVTLMARQMLAEKKQPSSHKISSLCAELDPFLHAWLQGIVSPQKAAKKRQRRR